MSKKFKGFIYCITNKVNGKRYVGQTLRDGGIQVRWRAHRNELNKNKHHNKHLQAAWNKYEEENFEFEVLHELHFSNQDTLLEALNDLETMYISIWHLLDINYGYNIASGGSSGNPFAGKSEEELKERSRKISEARKGKPSPTKGKKHTEETRKKLSEAKKGSIPWNKGIKCTEETINKISEATKGRIPWNKGTKCTQETKKKISEANKGRKHSEESKKKMSESHKGKNGTKVQCTETEEIFDFIRDAEEKYNPKHNRYANNITSCVRGKQKTAYGYHWKYVEENNLN